MEDVLVVVQDYVLVDVQVAVQDTVAADVLLVVVLVVQVVVMATVNQAVTVTAISTAKEAVKVAVDHAMELVTHAMVLVMDVQAALDAQAVLAVETVAEEDVQVAMENVGTALVAVDGVLVLVKDAT